MLSSNFPIPTHNYHYFDNILGIFNTIEPYRAPVSA